MDDDATREETLQKPVEFPELKKSDEKQEADVPELPAPDKPKAISFRPESDTPAPRKSTAKMVPEADLKPYTPKPNAGDNMETPDTLSDPVHVVGTVSLPEPPMSRYERQRENLRERAKQKPASKKLLPDEGNDTYQGTPEPEDVPDLPEPGKGKPKASGKPGVADSGGDDASGESGGQVVEKLDRMVELLQTISDKLEEIKNKDATATFA